MKRKDKMLKAFKGAQADANKGQAMSPGTGATGGTRGRGRDPSAQFSGNNNLSQKNKNALSAQRKGARAAISPSTTTGNQIAGAVMNAMIPFSGTVFKKAIDSKAMGYAHWLLPQNPHDPTTKHHQSLKHGHLLWPRLN
jgi:hypothetical protein